MKGQSAMTIKEMEARTGMSRANIRYYEQEGLIAPQRDSNGYRNYQESDVQALERILLMRRLGVSLEDIRALQAGSLPLGEAMERQADKLGREQQEAAAAQALCRSIQTTGVPYGRLDARPFLQAPQPPPELPAMDAILPLRHPWRRHLAPEPGSRPLFPAVVRLLGAGAAPFFPANGYGRPDPAYPDGHGPDAGIGALAALAFWRHLRKMGLWLAAGKRRRGPSRLLGGPGPHLIGAAKGPLLPDPHRVPRLSDQKLQAVQGRGAPALGRGLPLYHPGYPGLPGPGICPERPDDHRAHNPHHAGWADAAQPGRAGCGGFCPELQRPGRLLRGKRRLSPQQPGRVGGVDDRRRPPVRKGAILPFNIRWRTGC